MGIKQRAEAEYLRLEKIYKRAKKERLDSVLVVTLAKMNVLAKVLGYEPHESNF